MIRPALILIAILACLVQAACTGQDNNRQQAEFLVFGTVMEITTWGADDAENQRAFAQLQGMFQEMHRDWHAWEPGLLTAVNQAFADGEAIDASSGIVEMVRRSQEIEALSGGRFNPAIGALIRLWGFHTSVYPIEGPPPSASEIEELVALQPSSGDIRIDGLRLRTTNPSVQLDFGGIAKGYAIDLAIRKLRDLGIENAIVNAGGDLRAIGSKDGEAWRIAVRNPKGGVVGTLETGRDEAVFTSGVYERFRLDAQQRYPHILDPRTGWPVQEIASVTVAADEGLLADAAATALTVAGAEHWVGVARALGLDHVMLIDEDGTIYLTERMQERLQIEAGTKIKVVDFDRL
jgi:thiamine biosynthesis lipoprotein